MAVEFTVAGVPVPQGSKTAFVVGRRAVVTDSNAKVLKPWRTAVAEAAQSAPGFEAFEGAVSVEVEFVFPRPKTVKRMWPSVAPDIDKLLRALLDGITGSGLWGDDAQVVRVRALKSYGEMPRAIVLVESLEPGR
jgi:Holliday junction resolvase RusA-like endonuclease